MTLRRDSLRVLGSLVFLSVSLTTSAQTSDTGAAPDMGKLLATGGVSEVEGAGGGGLTPWALITGYGSRDSYGANVHYTVLETQDYRLESPGVAFGVLDRGEISFAQQQFEGTDKALYGVRLRQNIVGLKLRVAGDAVYDQDRFLPQIALGAQFKQDQGIAGLERLGVRNVTDLGAKNDSGTDLYASATKLFLDQSILANLTLRWTKANEFGLLGFGGNLHDDYSLEPELSLAYLFTRNVAAGIEYRAKPHNLSIDDEHDAYDAFIAWFPNKHVSITLAYVDLGAIVNVFNPANQRGFYLSAQIGF
ncbi:MAG: DUF3034 family protein [Burkholderiaceae bacterium]